MFRERHFILTMVATTRPAPFWENTYPIASEIFGPERLEQHARSLAGAQGISKQPIATQPIVNRLDDNAKTLLKVYRDICAAIDADKTVTPAAEWLADNYHLVEEHVRQTRSDLPDGFYRQLPKLAQGPLAGHPRIFGLVWGYVAHTDSQFDPVTFARFVNAYQDVQALDIGELWAAAIALRLILIENLRRISVRVNTARFEREAADSAADLILGNAQAADSQLVELKTDGNGKVTKPFAVQLQHRLRDLEGTAAVQQLSRLKDMVAAEGQTLEVIVADEHQRQAAANVSARNIVNSLRLVSDIDWQSWFEGVSGVDKALRAAGVYADMDFHSRNAYRTQIEELARGSGLAEMEVVSRVTALAQADMDGREPGYWLIGRGRAGLEQQIGYVPSLLNRVRLAARRAGLSGYLGVAFAATAFFTMLAGITLWTAGAPWWPSVAVLALVLLPLSEIALCGANYLVARLFEAVTLPGFELRDGVPANLRTLVAVPCLLTSREGAEELADRLEAHFLSSGSGELHFALVTDWTDSAAAETDEDRALLDRAIAAIAALNLRHHTDRFLLLHRRRSWNAAEAKWMGWERKRGKLHELNRVLRGAEDTNFTFVSGPLPKDVRFVITLDADTRLPHDVARRMVGKISHPLNRPVFDASGRLVVQGHAILQPRVTASLPTGHYGSYFQRIFSTARGTDPYAFAASEVYQDLFDEGSFTGKGIYDIDAFEQALAGRVPDDSILSHDLLEGVAARAALVSDIEVIDEFPEQYEVSAARQHRWTRGDWQLLPWIMGTRDTGPLPALGRWKMIDNLRRSLLPILQLAALFAGWLLLSTQAAMISTVVVVLSVLLPSLLPAMTDGLRIPSRSPLRLHVSAVRASISQAVAFAAASLVLLANSAALMADAIIRTLYRLTFSHHHLLEWTTAAQAQSEALPGLRRSYALMWPAPIAGAAALALMFARGHGAWFWLAPFAIAWIAAPAFAHWISQSAALEDELAASEADRSALRRTARRTWHFFETFVTPGDNMLPPDNFQEDPVPAVAHRTSPTNIGLYLLSTVAARELGWIGLAEAVGRMESCLASTDKLEKFRGHLYNWYDTATLAVLDPPYVSAVDSGNLAGHLVALANACEAWTVGPAESAASIAGIEDVLAILAEETENLALERKALRPLRANLLEQIARLGAALAKARVEPELFAIRLVELAVQAGAVATTAARLAAELPVGEREVLLRWSAGLRTTVESHFAEASANPETALSMRSRLASIAAAARRLAYGMEFGFLYDPQRNLLSIGYLVREAIRDASCYDMLASEARLASFFAIAKGDLPTRHWFRLGRTITSLNGGSALVSWSGSMFEYLMPSLVMRAPSGGLLDQTTRLVVGRQIDYAKGFSVPWGISESAYAARDREFTYQYSNFGIPGLGLKRGLGDNLVISPYSTGLAAMVAPRRAARNYEALAKAGAAGAYGFVEALDFTPARLAPGETVSRVRAYFAHHQGMTIVAILNAVREGVMRGYFHSEPVVRASELLLQERAPRDMLAEVAGEAVRAPPRAELAPVPPRSVDPSTGGAPATHLMSNGRYSVMLTAAGGGYSTWNGLALTRWREDPVADDWGQMFYLREPGTPSWWSAGHIPSRRKAERVEATFAEHRAEFSREDGPWHTTTECIVSPESDAEARRITIENRGPSARHIEVTSYVELVLAPAMADAAHPAFSKMFVETEFVEASGALLARRRKRSPGEPDVWIAQVMLADTQPGAPAEYETDRARFIGRCNDVHGPAAMAGEGKLSNTAGTVLDPVFALRRRLRVPRGRQVRVTLWTLVASSRDEALDLVDRHAQEAAFERALMLAWTQAQIQLRHLSISPEEAQLFQDIGSHIIYSNPALRPPPTALRDDIGPQNLLWSQGISGDRPIVLLRIDSGDDIDCAKQLLRAWDYWRAKRLAVDLVILNDRMSSYIQDLQGALEALARMALTQSPPGPGVPAGSIFLVRADLATGETVRALAAAARVVFHARHGSIAVQLARLRPLVSASSYLLPPPPARTTAFTASNLPTAGLLFFNGTGGFSPDGRQYIIHPSADKPTPAPWTNVVANPAFGFHSTSDGAGYTWFGNSRDMQITGWSNDPVANRPSEAVYVTDKATGASYSPTLLPLKSSEGTYAVRHGFGFTAFERRVDGLDMELAQLVPGSDPVKLSRLRLTNSSGQRRTLLVTFYAEWVLGQSRAATAHFLRTEFDAATGAMLAQNKWTPNQPPMVAFADLGGEQQSWTGDRLEFLGRYGSMSAPLALRRGHVLSGKVGAGLDPCVALQAEITLEPGATRDVAILLGAAQDAQAARALVTDYRAIKFDDVRRDVAAHWSKTLSAVQVKTPDAAFDVMMNGWLLYQTIVCRMWARSGFYQASGAYGFRDQLQDSMALLWARPDLARAHLLRAAARQFLEGDVQHWWLPASGTGIRTRFSDDHFWLAHCAARYVSVTADVSVLDEMVEFLDGPLLQAGDHDAFFPPIASGQSATLYEHCARGIAEGLKTGRHGLPLMGGGDWNDGMNRVGAGGEGESVWLGWFAVDTIGEFAKLALSRSDGRAAEWIAKTDGLTAALERDGWDGAWYRRAYYDDGMPLGSSSSDECKIDAIAQSWAVISGAARPERARTAMAEAWERLVRPADKLALLFTPPFDTTDKDPGYIKGYPPGIRENGGQYTHGAIWSVFALAQLGEAEKAWALFAMLNPVNHAATTADAALYRVEPYVVAADIYSVAPHVGRGGWTWYTGAAGWLYRAGLEAILGIERQGNMLRVKPSFPPGWESFEVSLPFGEARYEIKVRRGEKIGETRTIEMIDDGEVHDVELVI